jgi:transcriptional repressor NrdR
MRCPYCGSTRLKVTDKRPSQDAIRRRRECISCKKRFTTYETISIPEIFVIKKNKQKERFDIQKVEKGIEKAFEKRNVEKKKIEKIVEEIENQILKKGKKEITSKEIGKMVMNKIKKIDEIAYFRFTSVHKDFSDLDELKKEMRDF